MRIPRGSVWRTAQSSARPAFSFIKHSTQSLRTGNIESETNCGSSAFTSDQSFLRASQSAGPRCRPPPCRVFHQIIEGQPPLPMAKKSNYQNRCDQKRNRQPQLRHRLMISPHGAAKFCVITASTVRWHGTLKSWLGSSSRNSVSVFISYLQSVHELNLLQIHALTRWP